MNAIWKLGIVLVSGAFLAAAAYQVSQRLADQPQTQAEEQLRQPMQANSNQMGAGGHYPVNWVWPPPRQFAPVTGGYPWDVMNVEHVGRMAMGDGMFRSCVGPNYWEHAHRYIALYGPPPY